jgi:hypothetical protein
MEGCFLFFAWLDADLIVLEGGGHIKKYILYTPSLNYT